MSWGRVIGHERPRERLQRAIARGRLASTYLFVGPAGIGKRMFAMRLAQALLCERAAEAELQPCEHCASCQQVAAGAHPDLEMVARPAERMVLPIELFVGTRDQRMRAGLCRWIALKPTAASRKIALIDDADYFSEESANCLLKTLEEPPPRSLIILLATSLQRQLPTIRSRAQVLRFQPLGTEQVSQLLVDRGMEAERAAALGQVSGGSVAHALELAEGSLSDYRDEFLAVLAQVHRLPVARQTEVSKYIDSAGSDLEPRRVRLRQLLNVAVEFFRQLMRQLAGRVPEGDAAMRAHLDAACRTWPGNAETAAGCLQRCLEAVRQVDAPAYLGVLVDCWLDDLRQIAAGKMWVT